MRFDYEKNATINRLSNIFHPRMPYRGNLYVSGEEKIVGKSIWQLLRIYDILPLILFGERFFTALLILSCLHERYMKDWRPVNLSLFSLLCWEQDSEEFTRYISLGKAWEIIVHRNIKNSFPQNVDSSTLTKRIKIKIWEK